MNLIRFPSVFPLEDSHVLLQGPAGQLEALIQLPAIDDVKHAGVAVICHPNPLQGGTMHNKVVHMLAKAYLARGFKVVRFNYRGIGQSEGQFGEVVGEIADLDAVMRWVKQTLGDAIPISLAGFSFGTYVSAYWAITHQWPIEQLISVAPAVGIRTLDYPGLVAEHELLWENNQNINWLVIQGDKDEVVSAQDVYNWVNNLPEALKPQVKLEKFEETGHFFHGKLSALKEVLIKNIKIT